MLAAGRDPQRLRGVRRQPAELRAHPLAVDELHRPAVRVAVRVGGVRRVDRRDDRREPSVLRHRLSSLTATIPEKTTTFAGPGRNRRPFPRPPASLRDGPTEDRNAHAHGKDLRPRDRRARRSAPPGRRPTPSAPAPTPSRAPSRSRILLPPPNVTGSLHMGHAFNHTLMDILARWHRMRGFDVLWQPGLDHAGIATQMVVERELAKAGNAGRRDMGREAFVAKVWEWKAQSGGTILEQSRRLGDSFDLSRNAFTMSGAPGAPAGEEGNFHDAVLKTFVEFYERGLIYPRQAARQLGPALRDGDLRPRGRAGRGEGPPLAPALSAGEGRDLRAPGRLRRRGQADRLRDPRLPRRRDDAAGDHARRHRRRRPPRRRAL